MMTYPEEGVAARDEVAEQVTAFDEHY